MAFPPPHRMIGVVSGMIVWAIWFVSVYALTSVGCSEGWNRRAVTGGNLLSLLLVLGSIVSLVLIAWCARVGFAAWRRETGGQGAGHEAEQRERFMGMVMFVVALLAALGTLLASIPILMLDPCAA